MRFHGARYLSGNEWLQFNNPKGLTYVVNPNKKMLEGAFIGMDCKVYVVYTDSRPCTTVFIPKTDGLCEIYPLQAIPEEYRKRFPRLPGGWHKPESFAPSK